MRLLGAAALLVVQTGDHERATTLGQELLTLTQEQSDREAEVTAWLVLSRAANQGAANIAAMTYAETGLALARELGDIPMLPWMLQRLGIEAQIAGDHVRAAELIEEALGLFRTAHDVRGTAYALTNLGWTRHSLGEVSRAAALYQENLILHQGLRDVWETAGVLEHTAFLVAEAGSAYPAARLLGAVAGLYQRTGTTRQPYFREIHDPAESLARAALSSEAYAAAWEAGRQLSLDQAIEEGLAALRAFE
jgi:tetratricopeptide (TPR) repeat protein